MVKANGKTKKKRAKQLEIPATKRARDPDVANAAEELADASEALTDAHEDRERAATALIAVMKKKKLASYVDDKLKIRVDLVDGTTKVKLKRLEEKGSSAAA